MNSNKIVIASNNLGKISEINNFLTRNQIINYTLLPQSEFNVTEIEESGTTFIENAIIKARHASKASNLPAIGDDSGIMFMGLNGYPGLYSSRFAGENKTREEKCLFLLNKYKDAKSNNPNLSDRAKCVCVLALLQHHEDPLPAIFIGELNCRVSEEMRGTNGFGLEPLLWLPEYQQTLAEVSLDIKCQISHRAKALEKLANFLKE